MPAVRRNNEGATELAVQTNYGGYADEKFADTMQQGDKHPSRRPELLSAPEVPDFDFPATYNQCTGYVCRKMQELCEDGCDFRAYATGS